MQEGGFARGEQVRLPGEECLFRDAVVHPARGETGDAEGEGLDVFCFAAVFVGDEAGEAEGFGLRGQAEGGGRAVGAAL